MKSLIRAIIDRAALRQNLARVRAAAPSARVLAVVKANGYGHGSVVVAKALAAADGLAVARLEEGLALRAAGIAGRILLLEGVFGPDQLAIAAQQHFDLMVHSFEQLELLESRNGTESFSAWIKVDTGMNRLGFRVENFGEAYRRLARIANVAAHPMLVTHLASADDLADAKTPEQLRAFQAATAGLPGERSVANSAAILAWPDSHADWVRPGLVLYGITPFPSGSATDFGLRPAMTLLSEVISVKTVKTGETVGYGGEWRAERDTRMAVIAAGYGDGYPRNMPAGAPVMVAGRRASLIGRVSMDMMAADVTDLPAVATGDPVVLWGDGVPVEELSRLADTSPYELVCGVSQRVQHEFR